MAFDYSTVTPEDFAKASFKYFCIKVLGYKWSKHHDEWYELLLNKKRILVECARGHGKTHFFSIAYPIWLIYRGYPVDILVVSYSEDQVRNNIMNKIDSVIMTNDHLATLRPTVKQIWTGQLKTFSNTSQIRAESFGSSVRGAHPDFLIIDDPLKDKGGMTPDEQLQYFMTALSGTAKSNTQILVVGTPLDKNDLLEQLENNKAYTFRSYPAVNSSNEALFTALYSRDWLEQREKEVGSFAFSREYLLQRIDPKNQMFKDQYRSINETGEFPEMAVLRTLVDPAISEKENACDSAIVTCGIDYKNHKWEYETNLMQSDNPSKLLEEIVKTALRYKDKCRDYAVVIEGELFQKVLAYDLRQIFLERGIDVRVILVVHQGIQGKHERIAGLQPSWEAGGIHLRVESPLIPQFRYYRPGIKGFKLDGIDALSWIRSEDVAIPVYDAPVVDPGCAEAWDM